MDIYNFFQYSDAIACAGLPKEDDFKRIKEAGYEVVISLSMPTDSITIENEDKILANLEIPYFHIPVDANAPKERDFKQFMQLLEAFNGYKVFIHCTKNCRLSTFIYLYHSIKKNELKETLLTQFCNPKKEWILFRKQILNTYNIEEKYKYAL